jgi:Uma2 family endonuclease
MALPAMNVDFLFEKDLYTEEEYFALEDSSRLRWEFVPKAMLDTRGERLGFIRAMSGGTSDHSALSLNLGAELVTALRMADRRGCRPFNSDLKVHCPDGRNTYPDVSVVCGPPEYYLGRRDIILNSVLVAEVLSPGTESDDRGDKWKSYQGISGLQYYLLLPPDQIRVELYSRNEAG